MGRREFITLLATVAAFSVCWLLPLRAQQAPLPVIGFLGSASPGPSAPYTAALLKGLEETGFVEGRNVTIDYRWADSQYDRLADMAAELVRRPVTAIVASGGPASALAAKAATTTIPIVFTAVSDPVGSGLVASFNRPGGNITGIAALTVELDAKRLELLRELMPTSGVIGAMVNPNRPYSDAQLKSLQAAAQSIGQHLVTLEVGSESGFNAAFSSLVQEHATALLVGADPFFASQRTRIIAWAEQHAVPAIYMSRDFADAGGLMSYGANIADAYRQAGIYTGQILKGAKPRDLPVVQPTKFELVINLRTAKAIGLKIPSTLLVRADEVIE